VLNRLRASAVVVLLVLATIVTLLAPVAVWGRNLLLNTDRYVSTVAPLASDPGVQQAVITAVDTQFADNVDVKDFATSVLPSAASVLAGPIAAATTTLVNTIVTKIVESPAFAKVWETMNRAAHAELVAALTGEKSSAASGLRAVVLDLSPVVAQVRAQLLAAGLVVAQNLPVVGPTITILNIDTIERAQAYTRFFDKVADWLPWLALLLFAGAIALARRRRRTLLISAACIAAAMVVLGLVLNVVRHFYLGGVSDYLTAATAGSIYDTVTRYLRDGLRIIFVVALLVMLVAWVFGPARRAVSLRRWAVAFATKPWTGRAETTPAGRFVADNHLALTGGVAVLAALIVVLWSNPPVALVLSVVIVALVLIGLIELIRIRSDPLLAL
jgi:hypothetical protein